MGDRWPFALLALCVAAASCGNAPEAPGREPPPSRQTASPAPPDTALPRSNGPTLKADGPGVVTGLVTFDGRPPPRKLVRMGMDPMCEPKHPVTVQGREVKGVLSDTAIVDEKGRVANAFVYVRDGLPAGSYEVPTRPVVLDQAGCQYEPHVFGVFAGQPVEIRNSDPTSHNLHATPVSNGVFDFSELPSTAPVTKTFERPEIGVPLSCNLHRWMRAYANVVTNPFFAVTGEDGSFELHGLPAGTFTIETWHEEFGRQTRTVTISAAGKTATAVFTFTGDAKHPRAKL